MSNSTFFLPSFGNRPAELVGRGDIVAGFSNALSQPVGHPNRSVLLIGQRGMGKTALLLEFADHAAKLGYVVARVTATNAILDDIIGAIQLNAGNLKEKRKVKGVSAGALGFSLGLTFSEEADKQLSFQNKMSLLLDELENQDKGLVILVDEIQAHAEALRLLTTAYQFLIGEKKNIAIAMAGLPHAISSILNDDVLTFFNRAKKIQLTSLPLNAISIYYAKVFNELGKKVSSKNLELMVEMTRGYPYLLQLIGYYLIEFAGISTEITTNHIELAEVSAKRDMIENIYAPVVKVLSDKDMDFLRAIAVDGSFGRISSIKNRLKVNDGLVQAYRKRLLDAGVISAKRRGEVEFTLPYFCEYLNSL
jgi:AAA+ ATPase superfamily predicted ATPase